MSKRKRKSPMHVTTKLTPEQHRKLTALAGKLTGEGDWNGRKTPNLARAVRVVIDRFVE